MADLLGQQLGNYRLTRLLGQGGFADVYLGEHIHLHTQAAIKILHTRLGDDDIENFRKEARMIAGLEHPHIVRVLDFGVEKGIPFLVMYYAPNGTLRHRHPKGTQLPLELVVAYVKQIAAALQYAHNQHLIHRDVKPENMLLGKNGEILLSDFGIALMTQSSRLQSTANVVGTAVYMAPEQLDGKPVSASDQYALGVVMYEWLSGTRPFQGSFVELYSQHHHVAPQPLREHISGIPQEVAQVVHQALAKNPQDRFSSVQALADALEQASKDEAGTMLPLPNYSPMIVQQKQAVSSAPPQLLAPVSSNMGSQSSVPTEAVLSASPTVLLNKPQHHGSISASQPLPQGSPSLALPLRRLSPVSTWLIKGNRGYQITIAILVLLLLFVSSLKVVPVVLSHGKVTLTSGPVIPSFVPTPTSTPTPVPLGTVLYQADWSKGADGWGVGGPWNISNGMLTDDGSNNLSNYTIFTPPYQPQSSNYAVDASIQFNQSTDIACGCLYIFGVVIGSDGVSKGYACQIDVVYNAALNAPVTATIVPMSDPSGGQDSTYTPIAPLKSYHYNVNPTKPHTFHVEVRGSQITFSIDYVKLLQIPDNSVHASDIHISGESVGLIDISADISVSSFKVTAL